MRVLDPACGSGNFLYVTLEHMKRLEGEVLNLLHDLGQSQGLLQLEGVTVDPHQFSASRSTPAPPASPKWCCGSATCNGTSAPTAASSPPQPVLHDFRNIENRDALITYTRRELVRDAAGRPLTRWDGVTTKPSPLPASRFPTNPRRSSNTAMSSRQRPPGRRPTTSSAIHPSSVPPPCAERSATATSKPCGAWPEVPESADFVMHWWHNAAEAVRAGRVRRFGFITTNSIKQTFNRRVVQAQLDAKNPLTLAFAIPDHPWVDAADGAAVRIAMTVGTADGADGHLLQVTDERRWR